jgi:hypothetical protein
MTKKAKRLNAETGTCSICGRQYVQWGNNAWPINDGRCCHECNMTKVIPERIARMYAAKLNSEL